jgi:signal transduction histidine kinase/DNA-binding response OmpR family regulator
MKSQLHILYLEDDPRDAELVQETLASNGIRAHVTRVETEADFIASLERGGFDLILADYTLPSFDDLSALKIAQQDRPHVPLIFVSGTLGEEVAIEALKFGATDYVFKTRLSRIVPSVQRPLREAEERIDLSRAEEALRRSEAYLAEAQKLSHTGSFGWDVSSGRIYWSQETFSIFECNPATEPTLELVFHRTHPEDRALVRQVLDRVSQERKDFDFEHRLLMPDGSVKYLRVVGRFSKEGSGSFEFVGAVMDITDLKRAEEMRAAMARERETFAQQRAGELAKANEALRRSLDALASVLELDDFLGQVMASITRQLGAVASTLRVRNFEQNTLPLELIFQDGRIMTPDEAKYPECWQSVSLEQFDPDLLYHSASKRAKDQQFVAIIRVLDPHSPMPDDQRSYLRELGVKTVLIIPLTSRGQANGRLTFRFTDERDFHPEELEIARALATQASLAIHLTRLAKAARQSAVLAERNHLAGEIHDSLGQFFTGISMQLGAAREAIKAGSASDLSSYIERAFDIAQFGLAESRRSAFSLQPTIIEESGLIDALKKMVERSNIPGRLRCNFRSTGVPEQSFPASVQQELLRTAQEAMSNALRHAKPTVISVDLRCNPRILVLEITDNGSGIADSQPASREGFGLSNMRTRASQIDGKLDIQTVAGHGTSIVLTVPSGGKDSGKKHTD